MDPRTRIAARSLALITPLVKPAPWPLGVVALSAALGACGIATEAPEPAAAATGALLPAAGSGSGSGLDPGGGSGVGPGGGSGSGSGVDPGGGSGSGVDPGGGGGGGGGGGDPQLPSSVKGAQITLAYSGNARYTLPAWSTLPAVQVVEELMIATFSQPDAAGPLTAENAAIFLHVVGDPFVDTYVFNFAPGVPNAPGAMQSPDGDWFLRTGGAPSQAGPPWTGRPEIILRQAVTTNWQSLNAWAVPSLYTANGWPTGSFIPNAQAAIRSAAVTVNSLDATAAIVTALYGPLAAGFYGGGPACATISRTCGGLIVGVSAGFVATYHAMQAGMTGRQALQAAGTALAAVTAVGTYATMLGQGVLPAVRAAATSCTAATTACGTEQAYYCGLVQNPGTALICAQDRRLASFTSAGLGAMLTFAFISAAQAPNLYIDFGAGFTN